MKRSEFKLNFSKRLNSLSQNMPGFANRSKTGIDITQLAKSAGVSYQMARKYALGMALPEYHIILKIAKWLNVSPSLLLFGEEYLHKQPGSPTLIQIEDEILKYILAKCIVLFSPKNDPNKIIQYIVDVIYDASHIKADKTTLQEIIDMMLSSAMRLNNIKNDTKEMEVTST